MIVVMVVLPVGPVAMIFTHLSVASAVHPAPQIPVAAIPVHVQAAIERALQVRVGRLVAAQLLHDNDLLLWGELPVGGGLPDDHALSHVLRSGRHDAGAVRDELGLHWELSGLLLLLLHDGHHSRLHGSHSRLHGGHSRLLLNELGLRRGSVRWDRHRFAVCTDHLIVCIDYGG